VDEGVAATNQDGVRLPLSWELFVLGVALLSLGNAVIFGLVRSDAVAQVVAIVDIGVTFVFVIDFLTRLARARSRRAYLIRQYGWLDLLSCIPGLRLVRLIRAFAVVRRLRRRTHSDADSLDLFENRARSILLFVMLLTIIVIEYGSMFILAVEEPAPDGNIKTATDALWYLVVTISTIGYGDQYPVTDAGRLMGTLVIVTGVALFSTLTGYLAHYFYSAGAGERQLLVERRRERRRREGEIPPEGNGGPEA
jgi:voltage-gated potassium channel